MPKEVIRNGEPQKRDGHHKMRRTALPAQINRQRTERIQDAIDSQGSIKNWINDFLVRRTAPPGLEFIAAEPELLQRLVTEKPRVGDYLKRPQLKTP